MSIIGELLKNCKLSDNQKRRWRKKQIVPLQVLDIVWESGIKFKTEAPETGLGLKCFLEMLWQYACTCEDGKLCAAAVNLYEDTVELELMPDWRKKVRAKSPKIEWPEKKEKPITVRVQHFK